MDINQTYCDDHFAVQRNRESLRYTPETNVICHYTSKIKTKELKIQKKRDRVDTVSERTLGVVRATWVKRN